MKLIESLRDSWNDFSANKGKLVSTIVLILVFLFVAALLVLLGQCVVRCTNKPEPPAPEETFVPDMPPVPPQDNDAAGQTTARKSSSKWDTEESGRWYKEPDAVDMDNLSHANDVLINNITGAAP